mgnify:CR=1 FL=1
MSEARILSGSPPRASYRRHRQGRCLQHRAVKNFRGTDSYLYLEQIILSSKKPPMAKIELEIGYKKSINREPRTVGVGDDLYFVSQEMEFAKNN